MYVIITLLVLKIEGNISEEKDWLKRIADGGLDIYRNFTKIVIEGISNVRWVSDCFLINCDSSRKHMIRII